jgi:hypothetical protein
MNRWRPSELEADVVRRVAVNLARRGWVPPSVGVDELKQAALLVLWQKKPQQDAGIVYVTVRSAMVDELRRLTGRTAESYRRMEAPSADEQGLAEGVCTDTPEALLMVKQAIAALATLPERWRVCVERLASGDLAQDVANDMGLTPSRVSQYMGRLHVQLEHKHFSSSTAVGNQRTGR